jgi:hypothetical protein
MQRFGQALDALLQRAGDELARVAVTMATLSRSRELQTQDLADVASSAGLLSALTRIEYYTADGVPLARWSGTSSAPELANLEGILERVRSTHEPITLLSCERECALHAFVPTFDRDGTEIAMVVGQLAADQLLAFNRVSGADVALLDAQGSGNRRVWGKPIRVLTNAPRLAPIFDGIQDVAPPPAGAVVTRITDDRHYLLQFHSLPAELTTPGSAPLALFIVDDTAAQQRIRSRRVCARSRSRRLARPAPAGSRDERAADASRAALR